MNPSSLMVFELVFQSKFLSGLILIGPAGNPETELKRVSKPVHTLARRCPMKPWILQRLPSNGSMLCEEKKKKKKKIFQRLAAIMASQQASAQEAKAGVSDPDLDGSVEKETGSKERLQNSGSRSRR